MAKKKAAIAPVAVDTWDPSDTCECSVQFLIDAAVEEGVFAYDLETTGLSPRKHRIEGIAFYVPNEKRPDRKPVRAWFPFTDGTMDYTVDGEVRSLRETLDQVKTMTELRSLWSIKNIIAVRANGIFDDAFLYCASGLDEPIIIENILADSMLADYVADERRQRYGLKGRVAEVFNHQMTTYSEAAGGQAQFGFANKKPLGVYSCDDTAWTYRLWKWAMEQIRRQDPPREHKDNWCSPLDNTPGVYSDLEKIFWQIEMKVQRILMEMELTGCFIDWQWLVKVQERLEKEKEEIIAEIKQKAGWVPNLRSPKQVSDFLYKPPEQGGLGLPTDGVDYNDDLDQYETGDKAIKHQESRYPLVGKLLKYRSLTVLESSFCQKLISLAQEEGRIYARFRQTGTVIGRLSCVAGDTVLQTSAGSIAISELDLSDGKNYTIDTHRGRLQRITRRIYKGLDAMYEVELDGGQRIKCTQDHQFLTPTGWRRLKELRVGSRLVVQADVHPSGRACQTGAVDSVGRRLIRQDLCGESSDSGRGHGALRGLLPGAHDVSATLRREVCGPVEAETRGQSFEGHQGNTAKSWRHEEGLQAQDQDRASKGAVVGAGRSRAEGCSDRETAQYNRAPCSPEHRSPQAGAVGRNADVLAAAGSRRIGPPRVYGSRIQGSCIRILCGSADVLPQALHGIRQDQTSPGGFEIVLQELGLLPEGWEGSQGSRHVFDEFSGTSTVDGAAGCRNFAPASQLHLQELGRGLRLSADDVDGRGGRRVSRVGRSYEEEGRSQAEEVRIDGLFGHEVHDEGGLRGDWPRRIGDRDFDTAEIISIAFVGVDHVWDISVEGDASYLAHGFVNHNSADPVNLMNQPRDKELIRKAFCAHLENDYDPERMDLCLIDADYGQMELRMAAHLAGEPNMIEVYLNTKGCANGPSGGPCERYLFHECKTCGDCTLPAIKQGMNVCGKCHSPDILHQARCRHVDLHQRTSEDVKVKRNPLAKNMNFGLLYRMGAPKFCVYAGLFDGEGKPRIEYGEELIEKWHEAYPGIADWHEREVRDLLKNNYIAYSLTRRRRRLDEEYKKNDFKAGTQAIQFRVSGSCQDIIKLAMIKIFVARDAKVANSPPAEAKLWSKFRFMIQVHDELVFECSKSIKHEACRLVKESMEGAAVGLRVPFVADARTGRCWDETH